MDREGIPEYCEPVAIFDDDAMGGRRTAIVRIRGQMWLLFKHPDGRWVTLRMATKRDCDLIRDAHAQGVTSP